MRKKKNSENILERTREMGEKGGKAFVQKIEDTADIARRKRGRKKRN